MNNVVTLKYCSYCAEHGSPFDSAPHTIKGYNGFYDDNYDKCLICGHDLIDCKIPSEDANSIMRFSTDENFLKEMITLYEKCRNYSVSGEFELVSFA